MLTDTSSLEFFHLSIYHGCLVHVYQYRHSVSTWGPSDLLCLFSLLLLHAPRLTGSSPLCPIHLHGTQCLLLQWYLLGPTKWHCHGYPSCSNVCYCILCYPWNSVYPPISTTTCQIWLIHWWWIWCLATPSWWFSPNWSPMMAEFSDLHKQFLPFYFRHKATCLGFLSQIYLHHLPWPYHHINCRKILYLSLWEGPQLISVFTTSLLSPSRHAERPHHQPC